MAWKQLPQSTDNLHQVAESCHCRLLQLVRPGHFVDLLFGLLQGIKFSYDKSTSTLKLTAQYSMLK